MMRKMQELVNSTHADAVADGYDIVQPKYSGEWVRIDVTLGTARLFNYYEEPVATIDVPDREVDCTLVGDFFGPPRFDEVRCVIWDCWQVGQYITEGREEHWRPDRKDITKFSWRDRFAFAKQQVGRLGPRFSVCVNYRITEAKTLWSTLGDDTCGLIYRRSKDDVGGVLRVARRYKEIPGELP